jgi:hypothetical protein
VQNGRFKLDKTTLGFCDVNGKRIAVSIPAGDIVTVIAQPRAGAKMVYVLWENREVIMYAVDLQLRGTVQAE